MHNKKWDWLKIMLSVKNLQFSSVLTNILPKFPMHELVILIKCHNDWMKIVDFFQTANFWASPIFYYPYFIRHWWIIKIRKTRPTSASIGSSKIVFKSVNRDCTEKNVTNIFSHSIIPVCFSHKWHKTN